MANNSNTTEALKKFYSEFKKNNALSLGRGVTAKRNIDSVNKLLDSLLGSADESERVRNMSKAKSVDNLTTETNNKPALPSYNVRAPYVEVYINDVMVIPSTDPNKFVDSRYDNIVSTSGGGADANFTNADYKAANIFSDKSFAKAVAGLDVLFQSVNLSMPFGGVAPTISGTLTLFSRTPIEFLSFLFDAGSDNPDGAGLPICQLRFGWNLSRADGKVEKILTPMLSFLIVNTQMADPGKSVGSEFTLTLQDSGSAVLQNSSADIGLLEDYPQEQLRVILEKFLGFRLFTLDDLLFLDEPEANQKILGTTVPQKLNYKTKKEVNEYYDKLVTEGTITAEQAKTAKEEFSQSYASAEAAGKKGETDIVGEVINSRRTFFSTDKTAAVRANSNTFEHVINSLVEKIYCRWYPVTNSELSKERQSSATAVDSIRQLQKQLADTQDVKVKEKLVKEVEKVATACILIYVPHFPRSLKTTSNDHFGEFPNEDGAFLLLPKVSSNYDLDALSLPLIYGPGGSAMPYLYGAAQNLFSRLSESDEGSTKGLSYRVGEVLDANVNYNNLVAVMKNTYTEEMAYAETGKHINNGYNVHLEKTNRQAEEEKLNKIKKDKFLGSADAFLAAWKTESNPRFTLVRSRLKGTLAPRGLVKNVGFVTTANTSGAFSARKVAELTLKHRLGTFLNYPVSLGMSILGDPYLIRQGVGAFELLNYFPTADGKSIRFNPLLSGVYVPLKITHHLSMGDYTTSIEAIKVPDRVRDTVKANIESLGKKASTIEDNPIEAAEAAIIYDAIQNINLEAMTGILGTSIDSVYTMTPKQSEKLRLARLKEKERLDKLTHDQLRSEANIKINEIVEDKIANLPGNSTQELIKWLLTRFDLAFIQTEIDEDKEIDSKNKTYKKYFISRIYNGEVDLTTSVTDIMQFNIGNAK